MKARNDFDTVNGAPTHGQDAAVRNRVPSRRPRVRFAPLTATPGAKAPTALSPSDQCFMRAAADDLNRVIAAVEQARSVMNRRCGIHARR